MVCTANDLLGWKDFPKGLRVLLLLDEDKDNTISGASEIRSKLEEMDYNVTIFYSENEALTAISNNSEGFHLAIVEVNQANTDGRFKFLESAKDLPIIMTSDVDCLSTMMKCIALGAVEFLKKPLSEDKLRNIWQHVVHKAFNAVQSERSETLKPEKESIFSILHFQMKTQESNKELRVETESGVHLQERSEEISAGNDKYPAPSTPQIKHGVRSIDDGDCQDQANYSMEKESMELDEECNKSVETNCDNLVDETTVEISPSQGLENGIIKEEDELTDISKTGNNVSAHPTSKDRVVDLASDGRKADEGSGLSNSRGNKSNRKKVKVDWTPELHKKFVEAVEKLGVDQAIPSRILEMMKVEGLTRHNVASHLQQKYRIQRKHILPKENERRWPQPKPYSTQRNCYPQKPVMAYPTYHPSNHGQIYPAWVPSHTYPPQMWHPPYYPTWQSAESWQWNPSYQGMHADAWGCPMMPPLLGPSLPFSQNPSQFQSSEAFHSNKTVPKNCFHDPGEEILDKVVKEAISKPWLPLPLGLKPPSTESVITELSKQGISTIPPYGTRPR